ncbi:MAG: hypothetical protein ACRDQA_09475 [Nocardioidaceae bacterium]
MAELIRARVLRQRVDYAHELKQRRGQGSGARVGYDDVLWAFVQGQVATLLLDPESCRAHSVQPANYRGLGMDVPAGASITADVALVAAAAGSGADMAVLPATATGEHPAAALLRWDESSAAR